jgi:dienelactone hydrolase
MHGPVLGLFGGADENIPPDQVDAFDSALADAGVEHEIVTYPAPRTPSSTAVTRSTPRRAPTPGGGCWPSSSASARRRALRAA